MLKYLYIFVINFTQKLNDIMTTLLINITLVLFGKSLNSMMFAERERESNNIVAFLYPTTTIAYCLFNLYMYEKNFY